MRHLTKPFLAILVPVALVLALPWLVRAVTESAPVGLGILDRPYVFIPSTFGEHGYYRGANVHEWTRWPVRFSSGPSACAACHQPQAALWNQGVHAGFGCETCHGPGVSHVQGDTTGEGAGKTSLAVKDSRALCALCHDATVPGRPPGFPQVVPATHAGALSCTACHNPHSPWPPGQKE